MRYMRKLYEEALFFLRQKVFVILVALTAVGSYGFAITHESIGVDDTMVGLYLEDGLEAFMGRWTVYLVNKLFHMGEFTPFITELAGCLLLLAAVVLYCVLLRRILGEQVGIGGYTAFACAFVSCPFISEVWIYYFHDGVDIGYVFIALALLFFLDGLEAAGRGKAGYYAGSMICLWIAVGCYESFVVLYLTGIFMILFFRGMAGKEKLTAALIPRLLIAGCLVLGCMLLRFLMQKAVAVVFSLQALEEIAVSREVVNGLETLLGQEWLAGVIMIIKRYWLVYFVNGVVYEPIARYVLASLVVGITSLILAVKKKNFWYPLLFLGMMIVPLLLSFVVSPPSWYHTCQYMPFFVASAVVLLYRFLKGCGKVAGMAVFALISLWLVWNQAYESNYSFYVDYLKYEHTKEILTAIEQKVSAQYGEDARVIFTGKYKEPYELVKDYYAPYSSEEFHRISVLTDWLDPHLKEKYYGPYGYYFGGEAQSSLIEWGMYAFEKPGQELGNFLRMHGYQMDVVSDPVLVEKAEAFAEGMPGWPKEGSMAVMDGYVVVHFQVGE